MSGTYFNRSDRLQIAKITTSDEPENTNKGHTGVRKCKCTTGSTKSFLSKNTFISTIPKSKVSKLQNWTVLVRKPPRIIEKTIFIEQNMTKNLKCTTSSTFCYL